MDLSRGDVFTTLLASPLLFHAAPTRVPRTMHFYYCAISSRPPRSSSHPGESRGHLKAQKPRGSFNFGRCYLPTIKKGGKKEREKKRKVPHLAFSPHRIKWSPAICHPERGDVFLRGRTNPSVVFSTRPSPTNPRTINLSKVLQIASLLASNLPVFFFRRTEFSAKSSFADSRIDRTSDRAASRSITSNFTHVFSAGRNGSGIIFHCVPLS